MRPLLNEPTMYAHPTDGAAPRPLTDAERARTRLNRIVAPAQNPDSLTRPETQAASAAPRRPRHGAGKREGFRLGWGSWLVIEILVIAIAAAAFLAWPPTSACREQEAKLGFYAGDTLGKCIRRGIAARIDDADQRLKMLLRGSGR
ncbi:hypothetical protein AFCDBAGC_2451 [Methylobacterium cerastii]|uniref:Uncharacterized protein n=1 Tax=Methylobacterium cerastii TaxID=932741 RepID=A0ABQ4QIM6_9HYPH|nr:MULTISPECIES: hypothetical protein [Methylobacterium]TXM66403.1 hypothetical protein FV226_23590 [Methylobacterium sp. WL12]TXN78532.1 hypothetical protein FV234_22545 [Methylobacterium sp. WL8]GJD44584.1 hypothetical protein AFCDBAGC_2451 [Methylobacterium cerastii]